MCILHATALQHFLEVGALIQMDFAAFSGYAHAQELLNIAKVATLPFLHEALL